jgi:hypothetical protein
VGVVFSVFPIMFFLVFAVVIGVFVTVLVKGVGQWSRNNHSPRLTVTATVVAKRAHVSHHHHHNDMHHMSTSSSYYVTFEVASGDRMELLVPTNEYGYLIEGDRGELTFQGTRYLGFARTI